MITYTIFDRYLNYWADLYVQYMLNLYFFPYYALGKINA